MTPTPKEIIKNVIFEIGLTLIYIAIGFCIGYLFAYQQVSDSVWEVCKLLIQLK